MTTPLFERLIVTCPNIGGGLGVVDGGCCFFLDGFRSTGICSLGDRLLVGRQPDHVVTIEAGRAEALAPSFPDIHDLASIDGTTYAVATTRNEIVAIDPDGRVLESWRRPGADDACHVNCLASWRGRVVFTVFGDFTDARGYIDKADGAGHLYDLRSGERLVSGLSQPHSPTPFRDGLLIANSGQMELQVYDGDLKLERSAILDGYVRGIHVGADAIYVGISRNRALDDAVSENARLVALDPDTLAEVGRIVLPAQEIYAIESLVESLGPLDVLVPLARMMDPKREAAPGAPPP